MENKIWRLPVRCCALLLAVLILAAAMPTAAQAAEMDAEEEAIYDAIISQMSPEELAWYGDDIEEYGKFIVNDPGYGRLSGKEPLYTDEAEQSSSVSATDITLFNQNPISLQKISTSSHSPFTGRTYTHDSRFDDCKRYMVIDVSFSQETIDFDTLATSGLVDGIILRLGRRGYKYPNVGEDSYFQKNYKGATDAGIPVGAYFYSQAITTAEAVEEAEFTLARLKGKNFTLPIFFDQEFDDNLVGRLYKAKLSKSQATAIAMKFCSIIADAGYDTGVYASSSYFKDHLNASEIADKYLIWVACWNSRVYSYFTYDYTMWQYTKKGRVPGIEKDVDCNFLYVRDTVVEATSVQISQTTANLWEGDTLSLTAKVAPSNCTESTEWSSSNKAVATVSNGKVTAVAAGKATITVTVGSISASCVVTVVKNEPEVETTTLSVNVRFDGSYSNGSRNASISLVDTSTGEEYSSQIPYKEGGTTASVTLPKSTYTLKITKANHTGYTHKKFTVGADTIARQIRLYGGDIDNSGLIDIIDKAMMIDAYSSCASDAWYSTAADINGDGFVNLVDAVILSDNMGKASVLVE